MLRRAPRDLTFVDLFCGCGGMSLGFQYAGFVPLLGIDVAKDSTATYRTNIGADALDIGIESFVDNLRKLKNEVIETGQRHHSAISKLTGGVDVVVGCPPCQGYSTLGRMSRGPKRTTQHQFLNRLWKAYSDAIELLQPRVIVTENIPLFLNSPEFKAFADRIQELGYDYKEGFLNAYEFGVPQRRRRAIVVASARGLMPTLPVPNGHHKTVRHAIGRLSRQPSGRNWHVGRKVTELSLSRYRVIPPGGNRFDLMRERPDLTPLCWLSKPTGTTDVFGRLVWDRPAPTIRTEFFKPEKGRYLHPEADRPITPREAAALQSFPCDFKFVGSYASVSRQIGEAVPPIMAQAIAEHVADILAANSNGESPVSASGSAVQPLQPVHCTECFDGCE